MQTDLKEFFYDKKILLTGHTTFLGSWLALLLHKLGAKVTGCSVKPPMYPNLFDEIDLNELIQSYLGDIRNYEYLSNVDQQFQPEIIIHVSPACGYIDSVEPKELYTLNLLGSLNVLELCRQSAHTKVFINLVPEYSAGLTLKNCEKKNQGELDLVTGSFRSTEFLTTGYRNAYFETGSNASHHKSIINIRTLPPIGGGDWSKNNLLQEFIQAVQKSKKQIVARSGKTRIMLHVLDVATGVLTATRNLYSGEPADVVCDSKIDPGHNWFKDEKWIAQSFSGLIPDRGITIKTEQKQAAKEVLKADDFSLGYIPVAGWSPQWDAETALKKTIEWHQARERGANMQRFSLGQVDEFINDENLI